MSRPSEAGLQSAKVIAVAAAPAAFAALAPVAIPRPGYPCPVSSDPTPPPAPRPLSAAFRDIVEALPRDWTDLRIDLRISDESRYVDASIPMTQINAQPYSEADWHWRINVANGFGHGAASETVSWVLEMLDRQGIAGEMIVRGLNEGRAEIVQMWGRPESVRREFRERRSI